jgi:DNA-binding response OmpR family regulator
LEIGLAIDGYEVMAAMNGVEGLKAAQRHLPDLVILDINMPQMDGLEVCRQLRQDDHLRTIPILFLTVRETIDERVRGLDAGADDYLTKPFGLQELKARIRALLRRAQMGAPTPAAGPAAEPETVVCGPLTLNLPARWVRVQGGEKIQLTPAEFELLHYLMSHPGQTFSSQELLQRVWREQKETADPSLPRRHMKNLRAKIEPDPSHPIYIRTVPHHGYILEA